MAKKKKSGQPPFGRLKRCKRIGGADQISALPDELLSRILTYLTLKEAMATSILSKRWKKLWVSHPNLDFGCFKRCKTELYVARVDKILEQFKGPKVHKFRVVCKMLQSYESHVYDWISFAIRKGVSELELNFNLLNLPDNLNKIYLPPKVFSGEEVVNSLHTISPNVGKHFESLKYLCLRSVNLSDEVFDIIFSSCFSLERVLLMYCNGLANAKNKAPHLKLKSLEIYLCCDLETLQLSAPNLVSFKYNGRERTLCITDAHQLASLRLSVLASPDRSQSLSYPTGKNFIFGQFSSHLPKLEYLFVTPNLFKDMSDFTGLGVFSNLKQLVIDAFVVSWVQVGYQVVASIIRASPNLALIEIFIPPVNFRNWEVRALELDPMPLHQNLQEVKLFGFRGDKNTMKLLEYLIQYSVSLRTVCLTALGASRVGDKLDIDPYVEDWNSYEDAFCKKCVMQLSQTSSPSKCPVSILLKP